MGALLLCSNYCVRYAAVAFFCSRDAFRLMAEEFIFIGRNKQNRQAAAKIRKTTTTEAGNLYKLSGRRQHAHKQGRAPSAN